MQPRRKKPVTEAAPITRLKVAQEGGFVSVRGLSKRFGGVAALSDIDLDIGRGSFTCLIGPSGCGKTTLLRILCGIESASAGSILCNGKDVSHLPPAARRMGMVFQSYALFPNLRVTANVAFGLPRILTIADRNARVASLLETVGLKGFERRRPDELSGGQQQRVAIARALAADPAILLLDEPLSALDPHLRAHLRGELKALQRKLGLTTIMVTHDQSEALAMADSVAVMRDGRVIQCGSPVELYARPVNRFVAGFLGAMNFLRGSVSEKDVVELSSGEMIPVPTRGLSRRMPVEIGIRPEDIEISDTSNSVMADMVLRVTRREFVGAVTYLDAVSVGGSAQLRLQTRQTAIGEGALLRVHLPTARLHLFECGQ